MSDQMCIVNVEHVSRHWAMTSIPMEIEDIYDVIVKNDMVDTSQITLPVDGGFVVIPNPILRECVFTVQKVQDD